MTRLASEHRRLFLFDNPARATAESPAAQARTRAMVLGLLRPGSWDALSRVWHSVQVDLQLPAPGIAVSGEGHELWFSVSQAVPPAQAQAFLDKLRANYLSDIPPHRVRIDAAPSAQSLPPRELGDGRWSAFVSADLAGLFADEPWLDIPPGDDAQAELLSKLGSIAPADFERVAAVAPKVLEATAPAAPPAASGYSPRFARHEDPRSFLLAVMNDPSAPLASRIEAAKALLPYTGGSPGA